MARSAFSYRNRSRAGSALVALFVLVATGTSCSVENDVGATPTEQLCNVMQAAISSTETEGPLELTTLLEDAVEDPGQLSSDLMALALSFQAWSGDYDNLGPYDPAVRFVGEFVPLAQAELIGPSTLSPKVRTSSQAVDEAIARGPCPDPE